MRKSYVVLILSILIISTSIFELTGYSVNFGSVYPYLIKPLTWIILGIIIFIFFRNTVLISRKYKKEVDFNVIISTLIYFMIYFILGYIKGFAHNPYDRSLSGIIINLWTFLPVLFVKEYARYFMINNCNKKRIFFWALYISLLFTFIELNVFKFDTYFESSLSTVEFFMQTFIPKLIVNLYLTYVSYFAGIGSPIIYALVPQLALYILPILPDLDWATVSILDATIPFFSYIYINYKINLIDRMNRANYEKTIGIKGMLAMVLMVVIMMCFGLGIFPVKPLVIASNSMAPKIHRGDIVLIVDKDVNKVKENDIIRYQMDGYYVVHRVQRVIKGKDGKVQFITKGDNNNDVDIFPVKENQFAGVVKLNIPLIGYPTLILNELLNSNAGDNVKVEKGN